MNVEPIQNPPDAGRTVGAEPRADLAEAGQGPAGALDSEGMGITADELTEGDLSGLGLARGKKRACARDPAGE